MNKAYKTLENEEGYRRCKEIIEEAVSRTDEMVKTKRKQLKKESKPQIVPEDQPEKVYFYINPIVCIDIFSCRVRFFKQGIVIWIR